METQWVEGSMLHPDPSAFLSHSSPITQSPLCCSVNPQIARFEAFRELAWANRAKDGLKWP